MRRIKAIYLLPVFILLLGGAACGGYFGLISPQMQKTQAARDAWKTAQQNEKTAEPRFQTTLDQRAKVAERLYYDFYNFHIIQETMPQVWSLATMYGKDEKSKRDGLVRWYTIMGTGQMAAEVNRWIRKFYLSSPPTVVYDKGPMGWEDSLPDKKLVSVDLGKQTFSGRGLPDLCNKILRSTGYNYFPLIIAMPGDTITLKVDRNDPRHSPKLPFLTLPYTATAYFMTRGWDPAGADAEKNRDTARDVLLKKASGGLQAPKFPPQPVDCPNVLWVMKPDMDSAAKGGGGAAPAPSPGGASPSPAGAPGGAPAGGPASPAAGPAGAPGAGGPSAPMGAPSGPPAGGAAAPAGAPSPMPPAPGK